jgi:Ca-activated chloride channel family protein
LAGLIFGLVNQNGTKMETVSERVLISFLRWMYPKVCLRRCCSEPLRKSKQIVSQIINQLGNDRIGVGMQVALFGVAHHY